MMHIWAALLGGRPTRASPLYLQTAFSGKQPLSRRISSEDSGPAQHAASFTDLELHPTVQDIAAACLQAQPGAARLPFKLAPAPPTVYVQHTAPFNAEALLHRAVQQGDV